MEQSMKTSKRRNMGDTAGLVAVVALSGVLYVTTLGYLWDRWMSDSQYSLAYLVPFVSGYFVWKQWKQAAQAERSSSGWGLGLIIAALGAHLVGSILDVAILSAISILVLLLGGCLYFRGSEFTRIMWFPLAYTVFAIPIPGGITDMVGFPLQLWASASTAHILNLIGIEVVRNGVNMSVPGFDFEVAQACSGMSSLVALVGVTAVFAYITKLPAKYRWALFALSLPVALIANVVRITTIALVGYSVGADAALGIYHDWSSPILFLVAVILLFAFSRGFEWLSERQTSR